jgi:hypothetical protein
MSRINRIKSVRSWGKILLGVGSCLAMFAIVAAVEQYRRDSLLSELCENKIVQEMPSPNRRAKVIVFTRDCGAAGFPQTIVAVVPTRFRGIPKHKLPDSRMVRPFGKAIATSPFVGATIIPC